MTYVVDSDSESDIEYEFQGKAIDKFAFDIEYDSEVTKFGPIQEVRKELGKLAREYDEAKARSRADWEKNDAQIKLLHDKLVSVNRVAQELANMPVLKLDAA